MLSPVLMVWYSIVGDNAKRIECEVLLGQFVGDDILKSHALNIKEGNYLIRTTNGTIKT